MYPCVPSLQGFGFPEGKEQGPGARQPAPGGGDPLPAGPHLLFPPARGGAGARGEAVQAALPEEPAKPLPGGGGLQHRPGRVSTSPLFTFTFTITDAFTQSDLQPFMHTSTVDLTTQGDSRLVRSSQGEAFRSGTWRHSVRRSQGSN